MRAGERPRPRPGSPASRAVAGASVGATLIVRDEESFLAGCLDSLAGCVDEVVVADTGSIDRTRDIAREHGARVIEHGWRDDFAAARNAAIDAARTDWVLYIDADERVSDWDRDRLAPILANPRAVAATVRFRPQSGFTRYREHRLFRRRSDLRFRGAIHESILPALDDIRAREDATVPASEVAIDHLGYDGDLDAKHRRNRPMLEARLASEPGHVYSRDHLGLVLLAAGDEAGAERAWREAIASASTHAAAEPGDVLPWLHLASFLVERGRDARTVIDEARERFPRDHALAWLDARTRLDAGDAAGAWPLFVALGGIDADTLCEDTAWDRSIFGANAWAAAGLCAFRLGRYAESAALYARAESLVPDHGEFRVKRQFAEVRARRAAARDQ